MLCVNVLLLVVRDQQGLLCLGGRLRMRLTRRHHGGTCAHAKDLPRDPAVFPQTEPYGPGQLSPEGDPRTQTAFTQNHYQGEGQ